MVDNVSTADTMPSALDTWRAIVVARQQQMDAAYAALHRTSADFWDRRADRFRAMGQRLPEDDLGLRLLRRLTDPGSTVLDVGAGAGRYARAIAPHVRRVVAVEPNGALVADLRTDVAADGLTNVEVVEARWEEADVGPADLVLCSHVLYPHAEIEAFVHKLDTHVRRTCLILATAAWREPALLLALWQRFHGEPRRGQPDAHHVFNVLYEMDIFPNVEAAPARGSMWTFDSVEDAVPACREHLILPADPEIDATLDAELRAALSPTPDGRLTLPDRPRIIAGLWWQRGE
ncbi:MAG: class I SAM-dependent methyltransferase [Dehalococcoidia bacterium]